MEQNMDGIDRKIDKIESLEKWIGWMDIFIMLCMELMEWNGIKQNGIGILYNDFMVIECCIGFCTLS